MTWIPIDQTLDNLATRLTRDVRDRKTGEELSFRIRLFGRDWAKAIGELRRCENLQDNIEKAIFQFIPDGQRIANTIWDTFEMQGLWDENTEGIADTARNALTREGFTGDVIVAILSGCECKKGA